MINLRLLIYGFVASLAASQTPSELRDLVKRAQDTNQVTRVDALDKLASYGEEAGLRDPNVEETNPRRELGGSSPSVIPALERALKDPDSRVRAVDLNL